jgi:hypothetical protein
MIEEIQELRNGECKTYTSESVTIKNIGNDNQRWIPSDGDSSLALIYEVD